MLDPMYEGVTENVDHMKSYQQLLNAKSFGEKPIIVVRSKPSEEPYDPAFVAEVIAEKMDHLEQKSEHYFSSLSANVDIVYSTSEKHHLHLADSDLVIANIKALKLKR